MADILESIDKDNSSVQTQIPQLEEYLSELLKLGLVSYNKNTGRYYISERK
jgi:DNA-binding IclR family transcriptional regulator